MLVRTKSRATNQETQPMKHHYHHHPLFQESLDAAPEDPREGEEEVAGE